MGNFSGRYWSSHLLRESNYGGSLPGREIPIHDIWLHCRSLHKNVCYFSLVPSHVDVDMSSILHTDYLEITPCVKWSLTNEVKNNGTL